MENIPIHEDPKAGSLDHLEPQARPWLVDIEILRKTDSLIRHLHMQVGAAPFARYLDFTGSSYKVPDGHSAPASTSQVAFINGTISSRPKASGMPAATS